MWKAEADIPPHGHVAYHSYIKQSAEKKSPLTFFPVQFSFNSIATCTESHLSHSALVGSMLHQVSFLTRNHHWNKDVLLTHHNPYTF